MMVSNKGSVFRLIVWQWRSVVLFLVAGIFAALVNLPVRESPIPRSQPLPRPA